MTLNQAIKTLNIEGRRLTAPSVRKLTGIKSDTVIRAAIDKFKADLSRKEKEKEEKSQMNVKCAEIVVRWRKKPHMGIDLHRRGKGKDRERRVASLHLSSCDRLRVRQAFAGPLLRLQRLFQGHDLATDSGKSSASGGENGAVLHLAW